MKFYKPVLFGTLSAALMASPAMAGMIPQDWDADGNNSVSQGEWNAAFDRHGVFNRIDENKTGILEYEEAVNSFVEYKDSYDIDKDLNLERDEVENGLFRTYDTNNNEQLSAAEFENFNARLKMLDS